MRDADGSVSWNDKMITGLSDGNRAEGESLLLGFIIQKASGRMHYAAIDMKRKLGLHMYHRSWKFQKVSLELMRICEISISGDRMQVYLAQ